MVLGLNTLLDPTVSSRILSKSSDISYFTRGFFRNTGESIGLPQAVPDNRKIDYMFRDTFMPVVMAAAFEGGFRAAEEWYVKPLIFKELRLDKLHQEYPLTPGGTVHLPKEIAEAFKKAKVPVQSYKNFPELLSNRMLGTIIQSRSYYTVPYLIEQEQIPKMAKELEELVKKGAPAAEIRKLESEIVHTRLLAHHMRRILDPERYLRKYLGPKGVNYLSEAHVEQVKGLLGKLDKFIKLFNEASMSRQDSVLEFRKLIKEFAAHEATRDSEFVRKLAALDNNRALVRELKGASVWDKSFKHLKKRLGFRKALRLIQRHEGMSSQTYINQVINQVLVPFAEHAHGKGSKVVGIFQDLAKSKLALANIHNVFKTGGMYVKLPMSILINLVAWTVLANNFDYFWLQPYQEKIAKKRGDTREIILPGYVAMIPGAIAFLGLMKAKPVQKLGYFGSFAVAALGGMATYLATTIALFYARLAKPRQPEGVQKQTTPPPFELHDELIPELVNELPIKRHHHSERTTNPVQSSSHATQYPFSQYQTGYAPFYGVKQFYPASAHTQYNTGWGGTTVPYYGTGNQQYTAQRGWRSY